MSDSVVRVEDLGKKYIIGHQKQERYTALRDVITNQVRSLTQVFNSQAQKDNSTEEEFWALKDVSFEIKQGDRVGIIGRNGAGKSTLLKILSRITEPSTGKISIRGRVASLLEVGTGFHPELTGRENIHLNGAILGMSRGEIKRKFDEIVAFAEVEKFLDTPVKRYSSGMYVRLAFSVAAHLEPEILIVDEVLAVGDAQFQKKCLGKMEDVSLKEGRTVLFVSHQMSAVEQLCNSAILLEFGQIKNFTTNIQLLIKNYLSPINNNELNSTEWINQGESKFDNPWFKPLRLAIVDEYGKNLTMPTRNDSEIWVQIEAEIEIVDPALTVGYAIYNEDNKLLYWSYQTDTSEDKWPKIEKGFVTLRSQIPKRFLNEGSYRLELLGSLHVRKSLFSLGERTPTVYMSINQGLSDSPYWIHKRSCILAPVLEWELK